MADLFAIVLVHPVVDDAADAERLEILERVPVILIIGPAEEDLTQGLD